MRIRIVAVSTYRAIAETSTKTDWCCRTSASRVSLKCRAARDHATEICSDEFERVLLPSSRCITRLSTDTRGTSRRCIFDAVSSRTIALAPRPPFLFSFIRVRRSCRSCRLDARECRETSESSIERSSNARSISNRRKSVDGTSFLRSVLKIFFSDDDVIGLSWICRIEPRLG